METTKELTEILTAALNAYYPEYSKANPGNAWMIMQLLSDNCPNQDNKDVSPDTNALNETPREIEYNPTHLNDLRAQARPLREYQRLNEMVETIRDATNKAKSFLEDKDNSRFSNSISKETIDYFNDKKIPTGDKV